MSANTTQESIQMRDLDKALYSQEFHDLGSGSTEARRVYSGSRNLTLEHFIYTHFGHHDYRTLRTKFFDQGGKDLFLKIMRSYAVRNDDVWNSSRTVSKKVALRRNIDERYDVCVYAEGVKDIFGRGAVHAHYVLVPKEIDVSIDRIPFINYAETHERYKYEDSFGTIPTIEITLVNDLLES